MGFQENTIYEGNLTLDAYGNYSICESQAAVEVRDGALLLMTESSVTNNQYVGVSVLHGAKAHINDTTITGTSTISVENNDSQTFGGANVLVKQEVKQVFLINSFLKELRLRILFHLQMEHLFH